MHEANSMHPVSALNEAVMAHREAVLYRRRLQRAGWLLGMWAFGMTTLILLLSSDAAQRVYQAIDAWGGQ